MQKFSVNIGYIGIYLCWMDIDSGMKISFLIGAQRSLISISFRSVPYSSNPFQTK